MAYTFEVFKDKADEFRLRFRASNIEAMFSSQGYKQKRSALNAIASIQRNAPAADLKDEA